MSEDISPQRRGDLTEAAILNKLTHEGYAVSQPFDELYRLQAKTARPVPSRQGVIAFDCSNSVANTSEVSHKEYTSDEIDAFVVYSPDLD